MGEPMTDERLAEIKVWARSENVAWPDTEPDELIAEVDRLKACVRTHHDQRGNDRCFLDDLKLYRDALGIGPDPYVTALPPTPDMEESCRRYIRQRQCPAVAGTYPMPGGMTISQLAAEVDRLGTAADALAWIDANRPCVTPAEGGWAVMARGTLAVHHGATLSEAAGKAIRAGDGADSDG